PQIPAEQSRHSERRCAMSRVVGSNGDGPQSPGGSESRHCVERSSASSRPAIEGSRPHSLANAVRVITIAAALFLGLSPIAFAHTKSETYTVWHTSGPSVRATSSIPNVEADRLAKNGTRASNDEVASYLTSHVSASSKAGKCAMPSPVRAVAATEQFRRFDL